MCEESKEKLSLKELKFVQSDKFDNKDMNIEMVFAVIYISGNRYIVQCEMEKKSEYTVCQNIFRDIKIICYMTQMMAASFRWSDARLGK